MSSSPRRPIGPVCGLLLLILCPISWAADTPTIGTRLPAGNILEKQDPRLAEPAIVPAKPSAVEKTPASADPQGPSTQAKPTSMPASAALDRSYESKMPLSRHGGSKTIAKAAVTGQDGAVGATEAGTWHLWDAMPLAIVLALIAAAALVIKKYMPVKRMLTGAGALDIVARLPLSGKQSLLLVKMGRKLVLVGLSSEQMASLAVVDDPEQVAAIIGRVAGDRPDSITNAFADALGDETQAYAEETEVRDLSSAAGGCVRNLLDRVRQLTQKQEVA